MESIKKASVVKLIAVALSIVLAFVYVDSYLNFIDEKGALAAIMTVLITSGFVVWNELIMYVQRLENKFTAGKKTVAEARFWEVILMALSVVTHFGAEKDYIVLGMHCVVVYMVLCGCGHLLKGETSIYLPGDLFNGFVIMPFGNFIARTLTVIEAVKELTRKEEDGTKSRYRSLVAVVASIAFILVAILFFWIVFGLLSELDKNFLSAYNAVNSFFVKFFDFRYFCNFVSSVFLSIPVGMYLGGLYFGSSSKNNSFEKGIHAKIESNYKRLKVIPAVIFYIVSVLFIVMYLLFFISQSTLLFSGFAGIVPGKLTASQYAVEGFEQLAGVLVINFLGLGVMRLFSSKSVVDSKLTKAGSVALMVTSMIFAVIAASKIILYISRFGYTPLRFESMWFTVAAFVGAGSAIYNVITNKKTFKFWMFFSAVTFVLMNVMAGIFEIV